MRSAQDTAGEDGVTDTPIYDALYSEYRRLFRTLPGDRTGEEALQFSGFSVWSAGRPAHTPGRHRGTGNSNGNGPAALPPGRTDNRMPGL
ncbi:hypothetical protein [Actinacidiphila alni]|uniref:hypothetical protein n=1 Tax=Actinacidiphila alni TaxID=380248 RepID=UPI0034516FAE